MSLKQIILLNKTINEDEVSFLYNSGDGRSYEEIINGKERNLSDIPTYLTEDFILDYTSSVEEPLYYSFDNIFSLICSSCDSFSHEIFLPETDGNYTFVLSNTSTPSGVFFSKNVVVDRTPPTINYNNTPNTQISISEINSNYLFLLSNFILSSDTKNYTITIKDIILTGSGSALTGSLQLQNGLNQINFLLYDFAGNSISKTFTVDYNPIIRFYFETLDSGPLTNFTFNGQSIIGNEVRLTHYDLVANSHLQFSKLGFESLSETFPIPDIYQFSYIYTIRYIFLNLTIWDRETLEILNQTTKIKLIALETNQEFAQEYTTNGTILITDFNEIPGRYRLEFSSNNYSSTEYFLFYTGYAPLSANIYLAKEDQTLPVKFIIRDESRSLLEGCLVEIKQYLFQLKKYSVVDMGITNSEGEIIKNLPYDQYYQYGVECEGEYYETNGQRITNNPITITFTPHPINIFPKYPNIFYIWEFIDSTNNSPSQIKFSYNDVNNEIERACIQIEEFFKGTSILKGEKDCINSTSATLYAPTNFSKNLTNSNSLKFSVYIDYLGGSHLLVSDTIKANGKTWELEESLWVGGLIVLFLFVIGALIHPYVGIFFTLLGVLICNTLGILAFPQSFLFGVIALLLGIIIYKGDSR